MHLARIGINVKGVSMQFDQPTATRSAFWLKQIGPLRCSIVRLSGINRRLLPKQKIAAFDPQQTSIDSSGKVRE